MDDDTLDCAYCGDTFVKYEPVPEVFYFYYLYLSECGKAAKLNRIGLENL